MIRINNIKIAPGHTEEELFNVVASKLKLESGQIDKIKKVKMSIDSRKHPDIFCVYSLDVFLKKNVSEKRIVSRLHNQNIVMANKESYEFPCSRDDFRKVKQLGDNRPVIVGFGPAGMFAALMLAKCGLSPIVIERGQSVDDRRKAVDKFWSGNELNLNSNVQFGEGGAGTFSDGKLNTSVKDSKHRINYVLRKFVEAGADPSIEYINKPHIGTDVLCDVVKNIREKIISLGGEVKFNSKLHDLIIKDGKISGIVVENVLDGSFFELRTDKVVLAIGHSARDTFEMLNLHPVEMIAKAFAVGVRIEHPQSLINANAYGKDYEKYAFKLPTADYKLTNQTKAGRGVYSFCMCPGGYVVNASSEEGKLAVNGMSYSKRDGKNANCALIVTVNPTDYAKADDKNMIDPMAGVNFQRKMEKMAYDTVRGAVPTQLLQDFKLNRASSGQGRISPCIKGQFGWGNVREILPEFIGDAIVESIPVFDHYIKGYDMEDAVISGVESRTSSPLRIVRDNEGFESNVKGLYPCGEGAGYAGGITSAAMDGIKVAEKVALSYLEN